MIFIFFGSFLRKKKTVKLLWNKSLKTPWKISKPKNHSIVKVKASVDHVDPKSTPILLGAHRLKSTLSWVGYEAAGFRDEKDENHIRWEKKNI